jgi:hypothetical protein
MENLHVAGLKFELAKKGQSARIFFGVGLGLGLAFLVLGS